MSLRQAKRLIEQGASLSFSRSSVTTYEIVVVDRKLNGESKKQKSAKAQ